jgi:hypothetical protein
MPKNDTERVPPLTVPEPDRLPDAEELSRLRTFSKPGTRYGDKSLRLVGEAVAVLLPAYERQVEQLAECYRLTGSDCDGNEDWRLARHAVGAVRELRERVDENEKNYDALELKYRAKLWLGHGHIGGYGDDGEMQCSACAPFGEWDYRRAPIEKLEATIFAVQMTRASEKSKQAEIIDTSKTLDRVDPADVGHAVGADADDPWKNSTPREIALAYVDGQISAGKFAELLGLLPGERHDFKNEVHAFCDLRQKREPTLEDGIEKIETSTFELREKQTIDNCLAILRSLKKARVAHSKS